MEDLIEILQSKDMVTPKLIEWIKFKYETAFIFHSIVPAVQIYISVCSDTFEDYYSCIFNNMRALFEQFYWPISDKRLSNYSEHNVNGLKFLAI